MEVYSEKDIDKSSPIPLYFQVSRIIRGDIESGRYKPGDFIPTEEELQKQFHVSRATIRQAVSEIVYGGLVERMRSKGTIVLDPFPETVFNDFASFTNEIMESNLELTTEIIDFKHIAPPEIVCKKLELRPDELITRMERIRNVEGNPVAVEKWYGPCKYFPGLKKEMFKSSGKEQSTYYTLMKNYHIKMDRSEDTITPVGIENKEAKILHVQTGHPALLRTRISYADDDRPITFATGVYLIRLKFYLGRRKPSPEGV